MLHQEPPTCFNSEYTCVYHTSTLTGIPHTEERCQCSHDHCIDPNGHTVEICIGEGNCDPCEPQGIACTYNKGFTAMYCEQSTRRIVASCNSNNAVKNVSNAMQM